MCINIVEITTMSKTKTQKLVQTASDGVPWSSFCLALVARNQLSLEMGKSTSHAQQVVIMQAALLLFTAPFPNASSSCKEVPRQEMIWNDVWIVKAENSGQEKLEQEATELDRPCFSLATSFSLSLSLWVWRIHSSHSYPGLTVLL